MVLCPICKGRKEIELTIETLSSQESPENVMVKCHSCKGEGVITKEHNEALEEFKKVWCTCDKSEFGSYPEEGQCICGIYKHHVHCLNCGKITQIG